jgi:hypothetical protein
MDELHRVTVGPCFVERPPRRVLSLRGTIHADNDQ